MLLVVTEQHAEEAAFLWLLRDSAVSEPHYDLADLSELDDRVEAHLQGLRVAGTAGWEIALEALEMEEPGEAFVTAVLAFEGDDGKRLAKVLDTVGEEPELFRAVVSALGWVEAPHADKWIGSLRESKSLLHKHLAVAGLAVRRLPIESSLLSDALKQDNVAYAARTIRLIGEQKRQDQLEQLQKFSDGDDQRRFWALWSRTMLGDTDAAIGLKDFVVPDNPLAYRALDLAPRALDSAQCQAWLRDLAQDPATRRLALIGAGVTGDPVYVPTLISQMAEPEFARVAGEAFSMITGIDLAYDDLELDDPPEDFEAGPTEDPDDDDVDLDRDEDLPWPDHALVQQWWQQNGARFAPGQRYLCGQPVSETSCRQVLVKGLQRQRIAASYELALMNRDEPLFEWRAPGFRQELWLGLRQSRRRTS